jgi:hypothetical protein
MVCHSAKWFNNSGQASQSNEWLQYDYSTVPSLWTTCQAPLQCLATQQHGAILLTVCSEAGDKTGRTHTVEYIICYFCPVVSYNIGFYLPQGHLSGIGTHYNCPTLSYKRLG